MVYVFWFLVVVGIALYFVVKSYNALRQHAESVKESFSNISVVLRKKISLINQLGTVVGNYQESEKFVMLKVSSDSVQGVQNAMSQSGVMMAELGSLAQKYPDLKSNQQYNRLMDSMQATEQEVQNARLVYNRNAKVFNTARTSIPTVFYSNALGFGQAPYLALDNEESDQAGVQQSILSDDSERLNVLLGAAGQKALTMAKQGVQQGRLLAEKGAARIQQGASAEQFHYVDRQGKPMGPVSRADLDQLLAHGLITPETNIMSMTNKAWVTYGTLLMATTVTASDSPPSL